MKHFDTNFPFIQSKIKELKVAIFKPELDAPIKLPNSIIQVLKVEDDGHIWFYTSCSGSQAAHTDPFFYGYLDFYKKGTDCRIRVSGKAEIMLDEEEKNAESKNLTAGLVLVRLKIMQAEYFENRMVENLSWSAKLKSTWQQIFDLNTNRIFDFK